MLKLKICIKCYDYLDLLFCAVSCYFMIFRGFMATNNQCKYNIMSKVFTVSTKLAFIYIAKIPIVTSRTKQKTALQNRMMSNQVENLGDKILLVIFLIAFSAVRFCFDASL